MFTVNFAFLRSSTIKNLFLDSDFNDLENLKAGKEVAGVIGEVKNQDVIVIGGGDTGNDCVGTCIRLGAKSVTQLEMMPCPPAERLDSNPWPEWPKVLKTDYGQEEAIYNRKE